MRYIIVLGSNCGLREKAVKEATEFIASFCKVDFVTPVYESPDCLGTGHRYMNAVAAITSGLALETLTLRFKRYEEESGRTLRTRALGLVPIDIDVVASEEEVLRPSDFHSSYFKEGYALLPSSLKLLKNPIC